LDAGWGQLRTGDIFDRAWYMRRPPVAGKSGGCRAARTRSKT
jgi:hypothetical protein